MTTRRRPTRTGRTSPTRRAPRHTSTAYRRRRTPALGTTLGVALGMAVVTFVTHASWPVRIGLVALVVVLGLAYVLWTHRQEILAAAHEQAPETPVAQPDPPATADPKDPA